MPKQENNTTNKGIRVNNLILRTVYYRESMSKLYAFIVCTDVTDSGMGTEERRYWGEISHHGNLEDLTNIIAYGGKWDSLP